MNNKGQTLVLFVLLLPILTISIFLVNDLGNLTLEINNKENEMKETLKQNKIPQDKHYTYQKNNDITQLTYINKYKGMLKTYKIKIKYKSYIKDGKQIIEKGE